MCFFDAMGMKFEYEPEGLILSGATKYLPDLYLPAIGLWAECKPSFWTVDEENKGVALVKTLQQGVLLLDGPPGFKGYFGLLPAALDDGTVQCQSHHFSLDIHRYSKAFAERRLWVDPDFEGATTEAAAEQVFSEQYRYAVYSARAERFGS